MKKKKSKKAISDASTSKVPLSAKMAAKRKRKAEAKAARPSVTAKIRNLSSLSLMDALLINIRESYSVEQAEAFVSHSEFNNYEYMQDNDQLLLITRVLVRQLLHFRVTSGVPVVDIIYCIHPDNDPESWMNVFKEAVLPFIVHNKVNL